MPPPPDPPEDVDVDAEGEPVAVGPPTIPGPITELEAPVDEDDAADESDVDEEADSEMNSEVDELCVEVAKPEDRRFIALRLLTEACEADISARNATDAAESRLLMLIDAEAAVPDIDVVGVVELLLR